MTAVADGLVKRRSGTVQFGVNQSYLLRILPVQSARLPASFFPFLFVGV